MNISPARDHTDPPAAPPDWTIELGSEHVGEGVYFFCDVKRSGKVMFRIGIGGVSEEAKARKLLAAKARAWMTIEVMSRCSILVVEQVRSWISHA